MTPEQIELMAQEAMARIQRHINQSAAQHLRRWREQWG